LRDLWAMSDDELADLTRGSALSRAGVAGLRRSLAVALANSGSRAPAVSRTPGVE
jgi:epoxyqueuosine reductase QueG